MNLSTFSKTNGIRLEFDNDILIKYYNSNQDFIKEIK